MWLDGWMAEKRMFPESVHIAIKIRRLIYGIYKSSLLKNMGNLLSHVEITRHKDFDCVNIFVYDGPYQEFMINDFKFKIKKTLFLKDFPKNIIKSFNLFFYYVKKQLNMFKLVQNVLRRYKYSNLRRRKLKIRYDLFRLVYFKKWKFDDDTWHILRKWLFIATKNSHRNNRIMKFIFKYVYKKWILGSGYLNFARFLKKCIDKMSFFKTHVGFVFISNNSITAEMLSRFVSLKLEDQYRVGDLFKQLKKELLLAKRLVRWFHGFKIKISVDLPVAKGLSIIQCTKFYATNFINGTYRLLLFNCFIKK